MLKVGLTGGIGSGKSTVALIFQQLGVPVFFADDEAKRQMHENQQLIASIKQHFGDDIYHADGTLNRPKLAEIVFKNPEKLQLLNSLVHPAAIQAFEDWAMKQKSPFVLKEAAVLFESGTYKHNDINVLVTAPEQLRIDRVRFRDNASEEQIRSRIKNQMAEETKLKLADYVIINDEEHALIPQVMELHQTFLKRVDDRKFF